MTTLPTTDDILGAALLTAGSPRPMTAAEAVAWCWPGSPGTEVIGFGYALRHASWWRLTDGRPTGLDPADPLAGVYELVAFDGDRELRWLEDTGTGNAVVLTEDPALLPAEGVTVESAFSARRLPGPHLHGTRRHLLAEHVRSLDPGWVQIGADRLAAAAIPFRAEPGDDLSFGHLALHYVEYAHEDEHGNLTVVDSRLTGVRRCADQPVDGTTVSMGGR